MKEENKIFKGATALGLGTLVAKLLGAVYRIPLTSVLGSYGLGLYQMIFPVYTLLLDFSGLALPSAISKIISSYKGNDRENYAHNYLIAGLKLFVVFGGVCSVALVVFSTPISRFQGDINARYGYVFLAPSILLVSVICCFRGYFQGLMNMTPTAVSQIIEQTVKLLVGILAIKIFMPNLKMAVAGATMAITISEGVALLWLYVKYRKRKNKLGLIIYRDNETLLSKKITILKIGVPITLTGIMIPLSHVVDSFVIVNVLNMYRDDATSLYGILSGAVHTVIGLPVALCYGIATVAIPMVSSAGTDLEKDKASGKTALLTFAVSALFSVLTFTFSSVAINLLFSRFSTTESQTAINLLKISSPCIVLLSLVQTSNAILIGRGKLYSPIFSLGVGVLIKTVLSITLVSKTNINIYGGAIATIACYFFVCLINFIMIIRLKVRNESAKTFRREYAS